MPHVLSFTFPLANGLHARPASSLEASIRPFVSAVTFINRRNGREADARSVLALVATETRSGDPCVLRIEGADEAAAYAALAAFIPSDYLKADEPIAAPAEASKMPLPASLVAAGLCTYHAGQVACAGLGWGQLLVFFGRRTPPSAAPAGSREIETARLQGALQTVAADIERELGASTGTAAGILQAHSAMLRDPSFMRAAAFRVEAGDSAGQAVAAAVEALAAQLRTASSALIRERVLDLEDLGGRLLEKLGGAPAPAPILSGPTIFAAASLTPSRFLALDRSHLKGLVLGPAGATSHTAILARSFGIPTLTGLAAVLPGLSTGEEAILDGHLGLLAPRPPEGVRRFYRREQRKFEALRERLAAQSLEGDADHGLEIGATVASSEEISAGVSQGAEGVGLFRTEMLFLGRTEAPGEEEQYRIYSDALRAASGKTVIVRTLDIGGDKPAPFLNIPAEPNPFLGVRGVRWYEGRAGIIKAQLRALLRAALSGPLKVMIPMVSEVEEMRVCRRLLREAQDELRARGTPFAESIPLGAMLEIPSAAFAMEDLCAETDFFSLGTNDLAQYFFARDRENPAVSDPRRCFHPAFLRLLRSLTESAHRHGRWIGLCGEWGEDAAALPLICGLGIDEISVPGPRIPALKAAARALEPSVCAKRLEKALRCRSADEVIRLLRDKPCARAAAALITPDLVILNSDSSSKEEAIREMADALHLAGRTDRPEAIEAAVWEREKVYSTGFGDGFALPHAKSDELSATSMVLLRLREPVPWQSLDERPVELAVLLAVRAADHQKDHLAAISRFSRLAMREEFRERLRSENDAASLAELISASLSVQAPVRAE